MGALVKASLSALKSESAEICPVDLELDQFYRTYSGGFNFNFITALSGTQSFKNLNFTNFYLTDEYTLDNVTEFTGGRVIPKKIFSSLNFSAEAEGFLTFNPADRDTFEKTGTTYNGQYYGYPGITTDILAANDFEVELINSFECRISFLINNFRFYLVVSDDKEEDTQKKTLFVGQNKIDKDAAKLEYTIIKGGLGTTSDYLAFFSTKIKDPSDKFSLSQRYILENNGQTLVAQNISNIDDVNAFYFTTRAVKLGGEMDLNIPSPYNTSFVTYNKNGSKVDTSKSNFNLPSNYLLHTSSNSTKLKFDILNLKNIGNNFDEYVSSNNLLSSSDTDPIYVKGLRKYTSIFSDVDSEKNETLALNYVYNNFNIRVKQGSTFFTAPSSLNPFTQININDTKFVDSGAFSYTQPFLADRVYELDDEDGVKSEDATYLCTWLSGGVGKRGVWVDRYFYPDLASKEEALSSNNTYDVTYEQLVENLIMNNSSLKTSVEKKHMFDKKSDLVFQPNKRYRYERISKDELERRAPTNFCEGAVLTDRINNYFNAINKNGGFALGFNIKSDAGQFTIRSRRNDVNGGFEIERLRSGDLRVTFNLFDNSPEPPRVQVVSKIIDINPYVSNAIFLSFDAIRGSCNVYVNSEVVFSFDVKSYQLLNKMILFGIIEIISPTGTTEKLLKPDLENNRYLDDIYLTLSPLNEEQEITAVLTQNLNIIQDITVSLPCGMRNLTDTVTTVNSIGTNLKHRSNVVDINIKNLNIQDSSITEEVKTMILNNITSSLPETTNINDINFIDYK
tara:strand:- start:10237 stop:12609 length:2373 start_codon:yes stop_codon:yes gene_type:complete